ncbi:MAG: lipoprotein-releasing ABC transporter permease subunit [Alphaproteobacteria bacterium]|nr:lipoprotein-releasing ABC transporter permease subunit [Alphaproteobacteria bacterium]
MSGVFGHLERMLALRYIRSRRSEGFISVIAWFSLLGISLGVATLIIVMSVMNGFRAELVGRILGLNGHLVIYSSGPQGIPQFDTLAGRIGGIPGIMAVTPQIEGQVMASHDGFASGAVVRGVRWEDLAARKPLWDVLDAASIEGIKKKESILIGYELARTLGVKTGDTLSLLSPYGKKTAFGTIPERRRFEVAGIFNVGMHEYDKAFIFMPLDDAQSFFAMNNTVTALEIYAHDADQLEPISMNLNQTIGQNMRVYDWRQRNKSFLTALNVERNVMFIILSLIILVAAFNIISSMIMLVRSKNNDIAVLRAMGATKGSIMRVFMMTGSSIGLVGTVIGTLLGLGFCWNIDSIKNIVESLTGTELFAAEIYFLSTLPAKVDPNEVINVIIMAITLSFLSSVYPAWRASRIAPAEALRYG